MFADGTAAHATSTLKSASDSVAVAFVIISMDFLCAIHKWHKRQPDSVGQSESEK